MQKFPCLKSLVALESAHERRRLLIALYSSTHASRAEFHQAKQPSTEA